jgi:hypothetical protein
VVQLGIGARIRTTASLNVRAKANNGEGAKNVLCTQPAGTLGTIVDGPVKAGGNTWWNINYDSACSGWSVQDYLSTSLAFTSKSAQLATVATTISALSSLEVELQGLLAQVRNMIAALQ